MRPHTKIYMKALGYDISDFMPCEVCGAKGVDIHHLSARGMGSSKNKDVISNLMLLCRDCHVSLGDKAQHMDFLQLTHRKFLLKNAK